MHDPRDIPCGDGLYCNGPERCDVVIGCQAGTPPSLDDGVGCTVDSCDEDADAPLHRPDDGVCDNALYCDGVERCDAELDCRPGPPPSLDDGVGCTVDSCDEEADAPVHTPDDDACDDGLYCDGVETCDALGGCQGGTAPTGDDLLSCTVDRCDGGQDAIVHDGDACDCRGFGLVAFSCPTGLARYCAPSLDPYAAVQAKEACEACYGAPCHVERGDCAGLAYGPRPDGEFEPGDAYFGYQDGCSGGAGRIWRVTTSHVTYGRWAEL